MKLKMCDRTQSQVVSDVYSDFLLFSHYQIKCIVTEIGLTHSLPENKTLRLQPKRR
ncbi:hypothetical protein [[Scytonema hofmanni] UTEX B 1581]|nr:hypothetical protein [[Scytonema hofmanni] UTEX B 1581]